MTFTPSLKVSRGFTGVCVPADKDQLRHQVELKEIKFIIPASHSWFPQQAFQTVREPERAPHRRGASDLLTTIQSKNRWKNRRGEKSSERRRPIERNAELQPPQRKWTFNRHTDGPIHAYASIQAWARTRHHPSVCTPTHRGMSPWQPPNAEKQPRFCCHKRCRLHNRQTESNRGLPKAERRHNLLDCKWYVSGHYCSW